jgi:hypothetical protein
MKAEVPFVEEEVPVFVMKLSMMEKVIAVVLVIEIGSVVNITMILVMEWLWIKMRRNVWHYMWLKMRLWLIMGLWVIVWLRIIMRLWLGMKSPASSAMKLASATSTVELSTSAASAVIAASTTASPAVTASTVLGESC